jgi:hypothetical protein
MSPKLFEMKSKTESPHSHSRAAGAEKTQGPAKLCTALDSQKKRQGPEWNERGTSAVPGFWEDM